MQDITLEETSLQGAYEWSLATNWVTEKLLQSDNRRYIIKEFVDDCISHNQTNVFCILGAHHQKIISKRKIKSLTPDAHTLLLYLQCFLPEYMSLMFWSFALKCCEDQMNNLLCINKRLTPYQTCETQHVPREYQGISQVWMSSLRACQSPTIWHSQDAKVWASSQKRALCLTDLMCTLPDIQDTSLPCSMVCVTTTSELCHTWGHVKSPTHWAKLVEDSTEIHFTSNQPNNWQTLDDEDRLTEGDFLNTDTGAIMLLPWSVTDT